MLKKALSLFFPQTCLVCRRIISNQKYFCVDCLEKIQFIREPFCTLCGIPFPSSVSLSHPCADCLVDSPSFCGHRSLWVYEKPVNQLVYGLKYGERFDLLEPLAQSIFKEMREWFSDADILVPVPLSTSRLRTRTYNQSLELAKKLSKISGIPVAVHSLQKIRETVPQTELNRAERIQNLKNAFVWNDLKNNLKDKSVLLIDDVYTTGSTLKACAETLRKQEPCRVRGITLAMNVPEISSTH